MCIFRSLCQSIRVSKKRKSCLFLQYEWIRAWCIDFACALGLLYVERKTIVFDARAYAGSGMHKTWIENSTLIYTRLLYCLYKQLTFAFISFFGRSSQSNIRYDIVCFQPVGLAHNQGLLAYSRSEMVIVRLSMTRIDLCFISFYLFSIVIHLILMNTEMA